MRELAFAANRLMDARGGPPPAETPVIDVLPARVLKGRFHSSKDFHIEWPEGNSDAYSISFAPDRAKGLSDPRIRSIRVSRQAGILEVVDGYPSIYYVIFAVVLLLVCGGLSLLAWWGLKPFKGLEQMEARLQKLQLAREKKLAAQLEAGE
jgi:hypothetical protein